MNKLAYHSKNIIMFILLFTVGIMIDTALNTFFFSTPFVAMAIVPLMSIKKESGCNMAGISTTIYVIDKNDIEAFPNVATPVTPADTARYISDFTLKANKYWHTLYSTKEMGELVGETDGPTDGPFFRNKVTAFYPRTNAEGIGLANVLKDTDVIVIVKEFSGGGQMRVLGTDDIPATCKPSENSGKGFADEKGITFEFNAANCKLPMIYSGQIITETEILYAPERMAVDATSVDLIISKRWVVGANTAAIVLTTLNNMVPGDVVRIEYDAASTGSLAFNGAYGATALIDAAGEWFEITKANDNSLIITDGNFA